MRIKRVAPILVLIAGLASFADAQTAPPPADSQSYYIDRSGGEIRFIQRLSWRGDETAFRYEVTIEKHRYDDSQWEEVVKESVETDYIEVSLVAGIYRYKVQVYDLLDKPSGSPEWIDLTVMPAYQPVIYSFSPSRFFLDEDLRWDISVTGSDFVPPGEFGATDIYLRRIDGGETQSILRPESFTLRQDGAEMTFTVGSLIPGEYEVYVVNPGGLEATAQTFTIQYRKALDLNISVGYAPSFPLHGGLYDYFPDFVYPIGALVRAGFVFFKRPWGYMGVELVPSWGLFSSEGEGYKVTFHSINVMANYLFQYNLTRAWVINARAGAGLTLLYNVQFDFSVGESQAMSSAMPAIGVGVSAMWFFWKPAFAEFGVDYIYSISQDDATPGFLRPFISVGWQF